MVKKETPTNNTIITLKKVFFLVSSIKLFRDKEDKFNLESIKIAAINTDGKSVCAKEGPVIDAKNKREKMKAHTISKLLFVKLLSLNNNSNSFQKKNREKTNTIQKPRKLVKKSGRFGNRIRWDASEAVPPR